MTNPVAPGKEQDNVLSKRYLHRAVMKDRDKEYECHLAGDSRRYRWKAIPKDPVGMGEIAEESVEENQLDGLPE